MGSASAGRAAAGLGRREHRGRESLAGFLLKGTRRGKRLIAADKPPLFSCYEKMYKNVFFGPDFIGSGAFSEGKVLTGGGERS